MDLAACSPNTDATACSSLTGWLSCRLAACLLPQIYTLDRALRDARSRELDAYSLVIDLDGLSYHNMPPLNAIKTVRQQGQAAASDSAARLPGCPARSIK